MIATEETAPKEVKMPSKVTVKRPIAKRANRSISECIPTAVLSAAHAQSSTSTSTKKVPDQLHYDSPSNGRTSNYDINNGKQQNQRKLTQRQKWIERDEQAFGTPIDQSLNQDFDFEKNLALFNKEAVWEEINNSSKPDVIRQSEINKGKYRHDENVLLSKPTTLRQIIVPVNDDKEYVTDDGLIIPSITLDLHRQLIGAADRLGISWERRVSLHHFFFSN